MRTVQPAATCHSRPAGCFSKQRSLVSRVPHGKQQHRLAPHTPAPTAAARRASHVTHAAHDVLDSGSGNGSNGNRPHPPTTSGGSGGSSSGGPSALLLSVLCTLCGLIAAAPAHARVEHAKTKQAPAASSPVDAYVEQVWAVVGPTVNRLGFSGLLGMAAASALKWIGRTLIMLMGLAFLLVQSMSSSGMIEVRWPEVNKRVLSWLRFDPNAVTGDNVKRLAKSGMAMIAEGVPDVAGFLVGFTLGLRIL